MGCQEKNIIKSMNNDQLTITNEDKNTEYRRQETGDRRQKKNKLKEKNFASLLTLYIYEMNFLVFGNWDLFSSILYYLDLGFKKNNEVRFTNKKTWKK